MSVSDQFKNIVEQKNITRARIILKNSLLIDPTLSQFNEMLTYATNRINLYDRHDEKELIYDSSKWNEQYLNQQMARVVDNFSKERIDLLKKMVQYLYKPQIASSRINNQYTSKTQVNNKNKDINLFGKFFRFLFDDKNKQIKSIYECYEKIIKIINGTNYLDAQRKYDIRKYTEKIISNCQEFFKGEMSLRSDPGHKKNVNEEIKEQLSNIRENISKYSNSNDFDKKQIIRDIAQSAYKIQILLE